MSDNEDRRFTPETDNEEFLAKELCDVIERVLAIEKKINEIIERLPT